jgi:hypothetical protein
MNKEFIIKSNNTDRQLVFSNLTKHEDGDYYLQVQLGGSQVSANARVYTDNWPVTLNNFFQELVAPRTHGASQTFRACLLRCTSVAIGT